MGPDITLNPKNSLFKYLKCEHTTNIINHRAYKFAFIKL